MNEPFQDAPTPGEDWRPVARYTSLHEAGIAQGLLESAGIRSTLDNETMVGMLWHLSNAIGGVRVRVSPADEEAARALLAEGSDSAELAEPERNEAAAESDEEPAADDEPTESAREALVRRALVSALLGFFIPVVLHLWALALLAQVPFAPGRLDGRRKLRCAIVLALSAVGLAVYLPPLVTRFGLLR